MLNNGGIFLIQNDNSLVEMSEQPYLNEDELQRLLAKYPNLLAGNQIDPVEPRRWLLITREMGVPGEENGTDRWFLDHLFFDQDAIPTLVEIKHSSNTQIRREVIGQMMDYAANGPEYWSLDKIKASFDRTCQLQGNAAEKVLTDFLMEEATPEDFWEKGLTNLRAGKIRLVFLADQIPAELRRIVDFLNKQMNPAEVLAIEVKQYGSQGPNGNQGLKTLVSRVVTQKIIPPAPSKQWDETTFFARMGSTKSPAEVKVAREIYAWAKNKATFINWGKGNRNGCLMPFVKHNGRDYKLFNLLTDTRFELSAYYWGAAFDSEEKRKELENRFKPITGLSMSGDLLNFNTFPWLWLRMLTNEASLREFLAVFEWVIDQIKQSA